MVTQGFIIYNVVYWLTLLIFWKMMSLPIHKCNLQLKIVGISKRTLFLAVCIISVLVIIYVSGKYAHFRFITNLFKVYDIREEASSYDYSTLMAYLLSWTVAVNPLILGVCFTKKKWGLVVMSLVVQMLSFGIDGRKTTFFMPFLVISLLMVYKSGDFRLLKDLITVGVSMLTFLGIVEFYLFNTTFISLFGIRRIMIEPNQLGEFYYDFFTTHVPDYFRSSFLRHFGFLSPYTTGELKGFTYVISDVYYGKPNMNSNNGLASDGVANLGLAGCIIMPILLVIILKLLDRSAKNLDKRLMLVVAIYISYNLLSTTLMTCLLTHGFIMLILILPLIEGTAGERARCIECYDQEESA